MEAVVAGIYRHKPLGLFPGATTPRRLSCNVTGFELLMVETIARQSPRVRFHLTHWTLWRMRKGKGNWRDARGPTGHPPLISRLLALVHTVINKRAKACE